MKGISARRRRVWLALSLAGLLGAISNTIGIPWWLAVASACLLGVAFDVIETCIQSWR